MLVLKQSIPLCIVLSAIGGTFEVFATALLAYPDAQRQQGRNWSVTKLRAALAGNVLLQITASVFGNLLAPWFGPVSLVGPIFLSAQLLANMIVYGTVLRLERFTKDMRVGTYVVVVASVLLPAVGPEIQEDQNVVELLSRPLSIFWSVSFLFGMTVSSCFLLYDVKKLRVRYRFAILLVARATAFTVNLTVSKMMVLEGTPATLITSIILKIYSGAVMTGAIVVQSTAVSQATYVPMNATTIILANALTGIVLWEDWRVMQSWLGYICVFCFLILGNYLLLGDVEIEIFGPSEEKFERAFSMIRRGQRSPSTIEAITDPSESSIDVSTHEEANDEEATDTHEVNEDFVEDIESQEKPAKLHMAKTCAVGSFAGSEVNLSCDVSF